MDNLAHSLVGLTSAKAGLERLSPYATTICVISANAADADFVSLLFGDRWTLLQHHRGITHSVVVRIALVVWIIGLLSVIGLRFFGAQRQFGQRTAITALALLIMYWVGLGFGHRAAAANTLSIANSIAAPQHERVIRAATMPTEAT